jgi:hypothetical protein
VKRKMKVGLTFDQASDYGIEEGSMVFADFCYPGEVEWMAGAIKRIGFNIVVLNITKINKLIFMNCAQIIFNFSLTTII